MISMDKLNQTYKSQLQQITDEVMKEFSLYLIKPHLVCFIKNTYTDKNHTVTGLVPIIEQSEISDLPNPTGDGAVHRFLTPLSKAYFSGQHELLQFNNTLIQSSDATPKIWEKNYSIILTTSDSYTLGIIEHIKKIRSDPKIAELITTNRKISNKNTYLAMP